VKTCCVQTTRAKSLAAQKKPHDRKRSPAKPHDRKSSAGGSQNRKSAKTKTLLSSSEVGAPLAPRDVEASFRRGYYSPSTNLDGSEWEVMYCQFVESGLVVKPEPFCD
jgi:hypothetical protein